MISAALGYAISFAHDAFKWLTGHKTLLNEGPDPHRQWEADKAAVRARKAVGDDRGAGEAMKRARRSCQAALAVELQRERRRQNWRAK